MPGCCRLGWLQRLDDCIVVLQMCMPFDERSPSGDMGMLASNIFILRYIKYKSTDNNYNIDRQQSINIYIWSKTSRRGHLLAKPLQQKGFDPGGAWWVLSTRAILVGKMMKTWGRRDATSIAPGDDYFNGERDDQSWHFEGTQFQDKPSIWKNMINYRPHGCKEFCSRTEVMSSHVLLLWPTVPALLKTMLPNCPSCSCLRDGFSLGT